MVDSCTQGFKGFLCVRRMLSEASAELVPNFPELFEHNTTPLKELSAYEFVVWLCKLVVGFYVL